MGLFRDRFTVYKIGTKLRKKLKQNAMRHTHGAYAQSTAIIIVLENI